MMNTKEKILVAALRLFAVNGYEAVSVSQIAGELGITKGALYKHYKNKRDIFNCIFEYVCRLDVERSRKSGVPEQDYSDMPEAFSHVSAKSLGNYIPSGNIPNTYPSFIAFRIFFIVEISGFSLFIGITFNFFKIYANGFISKSSCQRTFGVY